MPIYEYRCDSCNYEQDIYMSISKRKTEECPSCGKKSFERMISSSMGFVRQDAKTLGQLADRNAKKMGRNEVYERDCIKKENGRVQIDQAKVELNSKLRKMNHEQKEKWIKDGA